jgi:hypothetical protein
MLLPFVAVASIPRSWICMLRVLVARDQYGVDEHLGGHPSIADLTAWKYRCFSYLDFPASASSFAFDSRIKMQMVDVWGHSDPE